MGNVSDSSLSETKSNLARFMPMNKKLRSGTAIGFCEQCTETTGVSDEAPTWFRLQQRQKVRFQEELKECIEAHAGMRFDIGNLNDEVTKKTQALNEAHIIIKKKKKMNRRIEAGATTLYC